MFGMKKKKDERFAYLDRQQISGYHQSEVICDTKTGVEYLIMASPNGISTVMLRNRDGKPLIHDFTEDDNNDNN